MAFTIWSCVQIMHNKARHPITTAFCEISASAMKENMNSISNDILKSIPNDLPIPTDDGACNHLVGNTMPNIKLLSTTSTYVDLSLIKGWSVIFFYPMTGKPGVPVPEGWVQIPGAAGCTPQTCSFRDNYSKLQSMNIQVFGISAQNTDDQSEASNRLNLPYMLLSDNSFELSNALNLPLLQVGNLKLIKRLTLITKNGIIKKCFYPVFPPDKNVDYVIEWLSNNAIQGC